MLPAHNLPVIHADLDQPCVSSARLGIAPINLLADAAASRAFWLFSSPRTRLHGRHSTPRRRRAGGVGADDENMRLQARARLCGGPKHGRAGRQSPSQPWVASGSRRVHRIASARRKTSRHPPQLAARVRVERTRQGGIPDTPPDQNVGPKHTYSYLFSTSRTGGLPAMVSFPFLMGSEHNGKCTLQSRRKSLGTPLCTGSRRLHWRLTRMRC